MCLKLSTQPVNNPEAIGLSVFSFLPNTGDRLPGTTLEGNWNFMSLKHNPLRTRDDVPSRYGSRDNTAQQWTEIEVRAEQ
jgi:hypothetical protein